MKFLKKLILTLLDIIIIVVSIFIVLALVYVFQTRMQHKSYSNIFGFTAFRVATGSMENTIEVGDIVIAKLDTPVNLNDIIVFQENDYFITHRLINFIDNKLITKGDANNSEDKAIDESQVIGKVVAIVSPTRLKIIKTEWRRKANEEKNNKISNSIINSYSFGKNNFQCLCQVPK